MLGTLTSLFTFIDDALKSLILKNILKEFYAKKFEMCCCLRKPWRDILVTTYNLFVIA